MSPAADTQEMASSIRVPVLVFIALTAFASSPLADEGAGRSTGAGTPLVSGTWSAVPPPAARHSHSAILDPVRNRMIVFGGYENNRNNELWSLSLTSSPPLWTRITPTGTPPFARLGHSAAYDAIRDRMIMIGVDDDDDLNEVWALSLPDPGAWSRVPIQGAPLVGPAEATTIFVPSSDRLVSFGGRIGTDGSSIVRELSLADTSAWTTLSPAGPTPPARFHHTALYDPVRNRMIVFGGEGDTIFGDVWALSLDATPTWTEITPDSAGPGPRLSARAIYDAAHDRMIVFGGAADREGDSLFDDTWALSLSGTPEWTELEVVGARPSTRYRHSAIYDPTVGRMLVFGGSDPSGQNDVWALPLDDLPGRAWEELVDLGDPPAERVNQGASYDPVLDRMLVFGGQSRGTFVLRNDLKALRFGGNRHWSSVLPTGAPSERASHSQIYDPIRRRLLIFGGYSDSTRFLNDLWELSLVGQPAWTQLHPAGGPPLGRWWHQAIYDPVRDRMIVLGGYNDQVTPNALSDVWALSLSGTPTWTQLPPLTGRYGSTGVHDPVRDRTIVFSGIGASGYLTDLRAYTGEGTWAFLTPAAGPAPVARAYGYSLYDPLRDRMILMGGRNGSTMLDDVWELVLTGAPTWKQLSPDGTPRPPRTGSSPVYDPIRDRVVAFGGDDPNNSFNNDTWALTFGQPVAPAVACTDGQEWTAGDSLEVRYEFSNLILANASAVSWSLSSARDWPGWPRTGVRNTSGASTETLVVKVPVPDSAAAGSNTLSMTIAYVGAWGNDAVCSHEIHSVLTATLASLVTAQAEPGRVQLRWHVSISGPVTVERRDAATGWTPIGESIADGSGYVAFEDRSIEPFGRYGYRLAWPSPSGAIVAGETWVDIPSANHLALLGMRPNPSSADHAVAFTLPAAGRARLELYDMAGRRVGGADDADRAAGFHLVAPRAWQKLAPGIYVVRLTYGERRLERRAVVVR